MKTYLITISHHGTNLLIELFAENVFGTIIHGLNKNIGRHETSSQALIDLISSITNAPYEVLGYFTIGKNILGQQASLIRPRQRHDSLKIKIVSKIKDDSNGNKEVNGGNDL